MSQQTVSRPKIRREEDQRGEDSSARNVREITKHCVSQAFMVPEGRLLGSVQRRCGEIWRHDGPKFAPGCGKRAAGK